MGAKCSGSGKKGSFSVTADEISINCKEYENTEIKRHRRFGKERSLSVHMTYVGLPLHLKDRRETLTPPSLIFVLSIPPKSVLRDLHINWGDLDVIHQVPQVLPKEIKTRIYAAYVLLRQNSPLETEIVASGFVNGRRIEETLTVNCCENFGNADVMMTNLEVLQNCMDNNSISEDIHPFGIHNSVAVLKRRTDSIKTLIEYPVDMEKQSFTSSTTTLCSIYFKKRKSNASGVGLDEAGDGNKVQNFKSKRHNLVIQNWISEDFDPASSEFEEDIHVKT